jgi:purine-binding chemotaxis protein CheW
MKEEGQLVVFALGSELYGVKISEVREIISEVEINKIPQMPRSMRGITNLRDKVTVIYDLGEKFGLGERENIEKSKILIADGSDIGFIVDDVKEIITITKDDIDSVGCLPIDNNLISGFAKSKENIITILNFDFLKKNEQNDVIVA